MSLRLLQIGASGQLGRELIARSESFGVATTALSRERLDLTDLDAVEAAVRSTDADAVVIAAAYTAVDKAESEEALAFRINAEAPGVIARACADRGLPLVHVSTDYVFDGGKASPWVETDPVSPLSAYGRSKAAGEAAIEASGARALTLRASWLFSPYGANFVKTMLRLAHTQPELRVVDDQRGRPTAAGDLAEFILRTALPRLVDRDENAAGVFHVAGAGETSWRGFAEAIFEARGDPQPIVVPVSTAAYPAVAARPLNSVLDCSKVERVFSVSLRPWRLGLSETLQALERPSAEAQS